MKSIHPRQGLALVACIALAGFLLAAQAQVTDNNYHCVQYQKNVINALIAYAQNYDEKLPPKLDTAAELQFYLSHYIASPLYFTCPDTRVAYQVNPAIAGKTIAELDLEQTVFVQDSVSHHDNLTTVAYGDGRILHGGKFIGDIRDLCMQNTVQVTQSLAEYTQDYDETLPPTKDYKAFDALLYPYLKSQWKFSCPDTGLPYRPNNRLSGLPLTEILNPVTTLSVYDEAPHLDGSKTIAFLDGHVTHGGFLSGPAAPTPERQCLSNVKRLNSAITMYLQDYDATYPPMHTAGELKRVLLPYINLQGTNLSQAFACPVTHLTYLFNGDLSGVSIASLASPATTIVIKDAKPHPGDGSVTYGFADGHAAQR